MKSILKKSMLWIGILSILLVLYSNYTVYNTSNGKTFYNINKIPSRKIGLLLGTSKYSKRKTLNQYFFNRIEAAVALFKHKKIEFILISGDNGRKNYNEPLDMQMELIKRGIPKSKIFLDYAGFDTYDSVYRASYIFGQNSMIVISQKFHNQRAVYIGQSLNMDVIGYNTADVKIAGGFRTKTREIFACVKAFVEVKINKEPTFLGDQIKIQ